MVEVSIWLGGGPSKIWIPATGLNLIPRPFIQHVVLFLYIIKPMMCEVTTVVGYTWN